MASKMAYFIRCSACAYTAKIRNKRDAFADKDRHELLEPVCGGVAIVTTQSGKEVIR